MVILLNFIPIVVLSIISYWSYLRFNKSEKKVKSLLFPAITALAFLLIYGQIQPSYLPKGEIRRSQVIPFEQEHYEVKDLMLKPLSGETRDERIKKLYNEELPFVENKPLTKQN